eukprot:1926770-Pleurochrysis_carterae.AAC.1
MWQTISSLWVVFCRCGRVVQLSSSGDPLRDIYSFEAIGVIVGFIRIGVLVPECAVWIARCVVCGHASVPGWVSAVGAPWRHGCRIGNGVNAACAEHVSERRP